MVIKSADKKFFLTNLMLWHQEKNNRSMPWKGEADPYKIWLSEIILQQTRTEQGRPYYEKFITNYPTIHHLNDAPEEEVFKLWQGLGYYSRCRNLIKAAAQIVNEYEGRLPGEYDQLLKIAGVGPYTAAAIASFGFKKHTAVIDGNVYRVLSRFFGIEEAIDSSIGKKIFYDLANELIQKEDPASFNQAIMDFGATVCKPKNPLCEECYLNKKCFALAHNLVGVLPFKSKKIVVKERFFLYLIIRKGEEIYMQQRVEKDVWQSLYEPFLIELDKKLSHKEQQAIIKDIFKTENITFLQDHKQRLTHQLIVSSWYTITLPSFKNSILNKGDFYTKELLQKLPLPLTIFSVLSKNGYF